jgi:hypothetical protein
LYKLAANISNTILYVLQLSFNHQTIEYVTRTTLVTTTRMKKWRTLMMMMMKPNWMSM